MAILVSGGAGYIGSHTCIELLNAGYDVVVADNYYNASPVVLDRVKQITGKDFRFYNADMTPALAVPYHFLLGSTPKELPAPAMQTPDGAALADVPKAIRERVLAILREESGVEVIEDTATLATDLGIDSLSLINVSVRLEEISGQPIEQLEALRTVGDCILAAAGLLGAAGEAAEPPAAAGGLT